MSELGNNLKEARVGWKMTLLQAADHIGVTEGFMSRLESGERAPSLDRLKQLAELYEVGLDELVGEES